MYTSLSLHRLQIVVFKYVFLILFFIFFIQTEPICLLLHNMMQFGALLHRLHIKNIVQLHLGTTHVETANNIKLIKHQFFASYSRPVKITDAITCAI